MNQILNKAKEYFQAPKNYFWQWSPDDDVIEWKNKVTICYNAELENILSGLTEHGIPTLGVILLLLSACQNKWKEIKYSHLFTLNNIIDKLEPEKSDPDNKLLKYNVNQTLDLLDIVADLPEELRIGEEKIYLLNEVLIKTKENNLSKQLRNLKDEFASGRLGNINNNEGKEITRKEFISDLKYLKNALEIFPNTESLELKLNTGVNKIPEKLLLDIPEINQSDLLKELSEDNKTFSISQLTKRLIAAIDLPLHSRGSGDQPFGGFLDITNRGNFDRLLLSELAQDDLLLMARLINNEALYFRREEPPVTPLRSRTILIDTTIKMWGLQRIFAFSAALACSLNNKYNSQIRSYSLGSDDFKNVNLSSKKGVIDLLQHQDIGLDCCQSLKRFMKLNSDKLTDYILITHDDLIKSPEFQVMFSELKLKLNFIITVNRNGELNFYEFINENTKLLISTKFDLDELLFSTMPRAKSNEICPAFMREEITPLYLSSPDMKLSNKNVYYLNEFGIIGVSQEQSVLHWEKKDKGAKELINFIDNGDYYFGFDQKNTVYILVNNNRNKLLKIYTISLECQGLQIIDFSNKIENILSIVFVDSTFYIRTNKELMSISCPDFKLEKNISIDTQIFSDYENKIRNQDLSYFRKFIYNGYNVLKKIRNVYLNDLGQLSLGEYTIVLDKKNNIVLEKIANTEYIDLLLTTEIIPIYMMDNPNIKFFKKVWKDGSQAIVDSRGILHLKSSDKDMPEISIMLVVGKNKRTACWSSENIVSGDLYFKKEYIGEIITDEYFYKSYIQEFIDKIIE